MRVRMLETVEDGNEFTSTDLVGFDVRTPYTIEEPVPITVGDQVVGYYRVEKLPKDAVVDLPSKQAEHLIALKLAALL